MRFSSRSRSRRSSPWSSRRAATARCCRRVNDSFSCGTIAQRNRSAVDLMTKTRHGAAVQKVGPGPDHMPIGEFGGAAALPPARAFADAGRIFYKNPANPFAHTTMGKTAAAAFEVFERATRRYSQPEWDIDSTLVGGERVPVHITSVWERPFCRLLHFERALEHVPKRPQPKLLIVAPMSGHYATLLRGTVEAFL